MTDRSNDPTLAVGHSCVLSASFATAGTQSFRPEKVGDGLARAVLGCRTRCRIRCAHPPGFGDLLAFPSYKQPAGTRSAIRTSSRARCTSGPGKGSPTARTVAGLERDRTGAYCTEGRVAGPYWATELSFSFFAGAPPRFEVGEAMIVGTALSVYHRLPHVRGHGPPAATPDRLAFWVSAGGTGALPPDAGLDLAPNWLSRSSAHHLRRPEPYLRRPRPSPLGPGPGRGEPPTPMFAFPSSRHLCPAFTKGTSPLPRLGYRGQKSF